MIEIIVFFHFSIFRDKKIKKKKVTACFFEQNQTSTHGIAYTAAMVSFEFIFWQKPAPMKFDSYD